MLHDLTRHAARSRSIHTTWVGVSTQILRLRFAPRRMTGEGAAQDDGGGRRAG